MIKNQKNNQSIYYFENYYYKNNDFQFYKKALLVTAQAIAGWSKDYHAKLFAPKRGLKEIEKKGLLPEQNRDKFVAETIKWLFENSQYEGNITFHLSFNQSEKADKPASFDYADGVCCWCLFLTEEEYQDLQKVWEKHNLPKDLFFHENLMIKAKPSGKTFKSKLSKILGGGYYFSPKEWQNGNKDSGQLIIQDK